MREKHSFVYILTNKHNTVLYTGVTADILKRTYQHKEKMTEGFTKQYKADKLVYYEYFSDIRDAIEREKQIKKLSRAKKQYLITGFNPGWEELYYSL